MTFSVVTGASDTTRGGQDCAADRHDAFRDGSAQSPHLRQSSARSGPQPYPATIGPRLPPQVHLDRSPLAQAARSTNIVNLDDRLSVCTCAPVNARAQSHAGRRRRAASSEEMGSPLQVVRLRSTAVREVHQAQPGGLSHSAVGRSAFRFIRCLPWAAGTCMPVRMPAGVE